MNNDFKFLSFTKNPFSKKERKIVAGYSIKYDNDKNCIKIYTGFAIRNPKDVLNIGIAKKLIKERIKFNPLVIYVNSPDINFGMYNMNMDDPKDVIDTERFEKLMRKSIEEFVQNIISCIVYSTDINRLIKMTPSIKDVIKIEKAEIYSKVEKTLPENYKTFEKSKRKEIFKETFKQVLKEKYKTIMEESIEKIEKEINESTQENIGEIENIEP